MDDHTSGQPASRHQRPHGPPLDQRGMLPADLRPGRYGPTYLIPVPVIEAIIAARPTPAPRQPSPRDLADLWEAVTALRDEVQEMREEVATLRAPQPMTRDDEQRPDELVGPRERQDERQAEKQRARETGECG